MTKQVELENILKEKINDILIEKINIMSIKYNSSSLEVYILQFSVNVIPKYPDSFAKTLMNILEL